MDVSFFLKMRTQFLRQLYDNATAPFFDRIRKIEAEEEPFVPPYSEDEEPPFLAEWQEAQESIHVLGISCVSLLASALHLYLKTWEKELRIPARESFKKEFKRGWTYGYKAYFRENVDIDWDLSGCDLRLLEELVLARNRAQHPENILRHTAEYGADDLKKIPKPFFASKRQLEVMESLTNESGEFWFGVSSIHVTPAKFHDAVTQVDVFCDWLENQITEKVYRNA